MNLGDKVSISCYYRKCSQHVEYGNLSESHAKELEETDQIIVQRAKTVTLDKPLKGIIAGKRKMALKTTLEYGRSNYDPEGYGEEKLHSTNSVIADVYLVATRLNCMYRVPVEWIEKI